MGFFDNKKATQGQYIADPYMKWNPEQIALSKGISGQLQQGSQAYSGDYAAGMTSEEQANYERASRIGALSEKGLSPLLTDEGQFPEEYFQQSIENPTMKRWNEETKPLLEEQYAGTGGYWGGARAGAVMKSSGDLRNDLLAQRSKLAYDTRESALNRRLTAANTLAGIPGQLQTTLQVPRLIQQYGLDQQYKEWTRGREESKQYIDQALNFLQLQSKGYEYQPGTAGKSSLFSKIAQPIGAGIGFLVGGPPGAMIGSQIGSTAGNISSGNWEGVNAGSSMSTIFPDWSGLLNASRTPSYNPTYSNESSMYSQQSKDMLNRLFSQGG